MGSSGIGYSTKELLEGFDSKQKKILRKMDEDELMTVGSRSQDKKFDLASSKGQNSSEGLDHFITEPAGIERNLFIADHEIMFSRSMREKLGSPRLERVLDRLSEYEKQKLFANLVKIQNDETVEVDLEKSALVASELLELRSFEASTVNGNFISETKKPVPQLQIFILVVGSWN